VNRALVALLQLFLAAFALAGWLLFALMFRPGGPCDRLGCESAAAWLIVLVGFSLVATWAIWPDRSER